MWGSELTKIVRKKQSHFSNLNIFKDFEQIIILTKPILSTLQ